LSNDGKFIEKNIGEALTNLLGKEAVAVRLHDTKSAAFFLPPSPADFMGIFKGGVPVIIEAKSSDENLSFSDCRVKDYVKPTQFAYHKMWMMMGGVSVFMFHSLLTKEVEYWNGKNVLLGYQKGKIHPLLVPAKTSHTVKAIGSYLPTFIKLIKENE